MTNSELHAVMTGGFATVAGSMMAAYIKMGVKPTYLLSASIMAAPGNALSAAAEGAFQGIQLVANIAAALISFMAFVAFLDALVGWLGLLAGFEDISFQYLLGKVFLPAAYLLGVNSNDTENVGKLLGLKTVVNEFVAYQELQKLSSSLKVRTIAISTYALCSFANIGSIGVQLGGLTYMAPNRKKDISSTILRALVTGSLVSLINACIAGILLSSDKDESEASICFF